MAYYAAFQHANLAYAIGFAESYEGSISVEKSETRKAMLRQVACDLSAKTAKDIFFEMNQKPESK